MAFVVPRRRRPELDLDVRMPLHEFLRDRLVELGERRERVEHVERDLPAHARRVGREMAREPDRSPSAVAILAMSCNPFHCLAVVDRFFRATLLT